jgi:hypothetical protein
MSRIRRTSPAILLTIGLLAGALLGPHAANAAGATLTTIVGLDNSTRAEVNGANQLLTAEAATNRMDKGRATYLPTEKSCKTLVAPPPGRGAILRQLTIGVAGKTSGVKLLHLYDDAPSASCTGPILHTVVVANIGNVVLPQTPGLVVLPGRVLRVKSRGEMHLFIQTLGYTVPAAAF